MSNRAFSDSAARILPAIDKIIAAKGFCGIVYVKDGAPDWTFYLGVNMDRETSPDVQALVRSMVIVPMNATLLKLRDELVRRVGT